VRFITRNLKQVVLDELGLACEAEVVVAYFNPEESVLNALQSVPEMTLVVSDEFQINNPFTLERLCPRATVKVEG